MLNSYQNWFKCIVKWHGAWSTEHAANSIEKGKRIQKTRKDD